MKRKKLLIIIITTILLTGSIKAQDMPEAEGDGMPPSPYGMPQKKSFMVKNVRLAVMYQIFSYAEVKNDTYPITNLLGFVLSSRVLNDLDAFIACSWQLQKASYPLDKWAQYQLGAEYRIFGGGFESFSFYPAAFASIDYISVTDIHRHHDEPKDASSVSFSPGIGLELYFPYKAFINFEFGVSLFSFPSHALGPLYRVKISSGYHFSINEKELTSTGAVIEKKVELILKNEKRITGVLVKENELNIILRIDEMGEVVFLRADIEDIYEVQ
ncbi:MAG: hypothetical protein OEZ22_03040 [Spirochaetia bacterium]|nr:hypothetical protein [Spirochaetia bacterium]